MSAKKLSNSARSLSRFRLLSVLLTSCIWIAPFCLAPASSAYASDTYTVTVNTDDYSGTPTTVTGTASNCPANATAAGCTLRDAITAANADTGSTIKFAVTGTNTLSFVLPVITTSTNVVGPGANALTISGGYQQFSVSGSTTTVLISGLTLANANNTVIGPGLMPSYAGAIYNLAATLTVDHVVFANNTTGQPSLPGEGGAILNNEGILNVNDCAFIGNYTQYSGVGGAITSIGTLAVNGSTFIGNNGVSGSAIYSLSGLSITGSTFTGNTGVFGAVVFTSGTMTVKDSTFVNNIATFGPNNGSDIYNDGNPPTYPATLIVTNSLFDAPSPGSSCVTTASPSDCPVNGVNGNVVAAVSALKLAPLGYYGGPTETLLPLAGSPALCASASSSFPGADQRGFGADIACGAGLVDAGSVQTNYLTVTTTADDAASSASCGATCTLRDAVTRAVAEGNGDITFSPGLAGTITLGKALPSISIPGSVDIVGPGASQLTVSGAGAYQMFNLASGTLDLTGLSIANGKSAASGGAINNTGGTVTLSGTYFSANSAATNGGAIYNSGALLAGDSTFGGNKAAMGSAIYNAGSVNAAYSTFASNAATSGGGIYNASGAAAKLINTTFAANTGTTGPGIDNLGSLAIANSALDSAECSGTGCPASSNGNVVNATHLAPLALYGGSTPTVLPQPGSSAICAGSAVLIPLFTAADQRGFPNDNVTYTGYSSSAPCVDSGAIQTNYTSVQFINSAESVAYANTIGQNPPVVVSVTENGQNIGGVPVTLTFSGAGSASGLTATTVAGTGATFSSLLVTQPGTSDMLSVNLPVVGSDILTTGPAALTVNPQPPQPPIITFVVPNHTYGDAAFAVAATSNSTGAITYGWVSGPATIKGNIVTITGAGTVVLSATQTAAGNYMAGYKTATFSVAQASQSITFTGLPSSATYTVGGPYTLTGKASSGLAVSYAVTGPGKISGTTLTLTGPGSVVVTASQSGGTNYLAAAPVSETINVLPAFTITITPPTENVFGGNIAIFLMQIQANPGFNGKVTLGCSGGPSGSTCLDFPMTVQFYNGQALALSGVFFPATTKAGTYTMTFTGVSGAASGSATATFVVSNSNNSGGWF